MVYFKHIEKHSKVVFSLSLMERWGRKSVAHRRGRHAKDQSLSRTRNPHAVASPYFIYIDTLELEDG
jgi:hypothetical protein